MKVKLTRVAIQDEKISAKGKPYRKMGIQIEGKDGVWINGFAYKQNEHWQAGQEVNINIEKTTWNGKEQINFSVPKGAMEHDVKELTARVAVLEDKVAKLGGYGPQEVAEELEADAIVSKDPFDKAEWSKEIPF